MHFESGMSPVGKATKHSLFKLRVNFIHWARLSYFCLWARRLNWCGKIVPKGDTVRATKWPPCEKKTDHVFVQWNQVWCLLENIRNGGNINPMVRFLRDTVRATTWPPGKRLTILYPLAGVESGLLSSWKESIFDGDCTNLNLILVLLIDFAMRQNWCGLKLNK